MENGLVTDYTSMIVMRDEQFKAHGIERKNKKRHEKEQLAKQQRSQAPVVNHRVDTHQPAFKSPRPSFGGGGGRAFNPLMYMPLVLLVLYRRRKMK